MSQDGYEEVNHIWRQFHDMLKVRREEHCYDIWSIHSDGCSDEDIERIAAQWDFVRGKDYEVIE